MPDSYENEADIPIPIEQEDSMKKSDSRESQSAPELIDKRIAELRDWRGRTLQRIRALIASADPDVVEDVKWRKPSNPMGVPVWSHDGLICTGETYKDKVKFTFAKGASLEDPANLFNASLEGNARRAIDLHEGEEIDASAFKALIRAAVSLNTSGRQVKPKRAKDPSLRHADQAAQPTRRYFSRSEIHGYEKTENR